MLDQDVWPRNLTHPPRHVALPLVAQLLFGGVVGALGWFFFGFGMIFVWVFALNTDPAAWWEFRQTLESANATVTSVDQTSFSEGGSEHSDGTRVYAVRYRFAHAGQTYEGVSYRLGAPAEVQVTARVEFPAGRPERSRLQGLRTAPCSSFVLFVVIFPLVGLMFILGKLAYGWRHTYLLKYGELAQGKLIAKARTNTSINDQTVYRLTFGYETSLGTPAEITVKTHETQLLEDDALETLLYDPVRPSRGTTLDHLPGRPRIDEDGSVVARHAPFALAALVLPILTILGHGTYVWLRFLR